MVGDVAELLDEGDTIIDGGNSYYRDDIARAREAAPRRASTTSTSARSGGVFGLERGYCLMIGGEDEVVERLEPIFATIAPGVGAAERTPGRTGEPAPRRRRAICTAGPIGAGHFVKMVHNGIEYGIMAAYAEGLDILRNADVGHARPAARRRDGPARPSRVLPLHDRHGRGRRGVAARQRRRLLAARPDRHRAARVGPDLEEYSGTGVGLGRGPVDVDRGHRGGRAGLRADGALLRAVQPRAATGRTPTGCSRPCASSSAVMSRCPQATERSPQQTERG